MPSADITRLGGALSAARRRLTSGQRAATVVAPRGRRGAFAGAAVNRFTGDWVFAPILSANRELQSDLTNLRRRSRELARNHDAVKRYLRLCDANIVGPNGIRLQATNRTPDGTLDRPLNQALERAWRLFCKPQHASLDRRHSLHAIARSLVRAKKRDGDGLARIIRGAPNRFGLALQLLDADQLDHEFNRAPGKGQNEIRMGVEIDANGVPVTYWIWSTHPSEYAHERSRIPVPAEEIIHLFDADRPGQVRGIPAPHAVMMRVQMLRGYEEAELVAARTAAAKQGFFKRAPEAAPLPTAQTGDETNVANDEKLRMEAEAGVFEELDVGMDFVPWDPQHPVQAYPAFVKAQQRGIATGFDVQYSTLFGDLEAVNYSSGKLGQQHDKDMWQLEQDQVIDLLYERVYGEFLLMGVVTGALQLPGEVARFAHAEWQPRGWISVDPYKDGQADALEIGMGLSTYRDKCAQRGVDFEDNLRTLAEEYTLAEELGVELSLPGFQPLPVTADDTRPSSGASTDTEDDAPPRRRRLLHTA